MSIDTQQILEHINGGIVGATAVGLAYGIACWTLRAARMLAQTAEDRAYNESRDWDDDERGHHHKW